MARVQHFRVFRNVCRAAPASNPILHIELEFRAGGRGTPERAGTWGRGVPILYIIIRNKSYSDAQFPFQQGGILITLFLIGYLDLQAVFPFWRVQPRSVVVSRWYD